eukprot:scaffold7078_cov165-Amphora_coffeaeformis.AAC.4
MYDRVAVTMKKDFVYQELDFVNNNNKKEKEVHEEDGSAETSNRSRLSAKTTPKQDDFRPSLSTASWLLAELSCDSPFVVDVYDIGIRRQPTKSSQLRRCISFSYAVYITSTIKFEHTTHVGADRRIYDIVFVKPRPRVRLLDEDDDNNNKVLGIRPKNLELAPRAVDTLNVKELKVVLEACDYEGSLAGLDKRDLQNAVTQLCSPERTAEVLVEQARRQQRTTSTSATTTSAATSSSTSTLPTVDKGQMQTAADRMANMDPVQLRQQAAMMKAMPKDQLRRSNPMFANM